MPGDPTTPTSTAASQSGPGQAPASGDPAGAAVTRERVAAEIAVVRGELARADGKAATVLALAGSALTIELGALATVALPVAAVVAGWVTVAVTTAAVLVVAGVIRPNLGGEHGLVTYAASTPEQIPTIVRGETYTAAVILIWLSRATVAKYRRIGAALTLLTCSLFPAAATAALAAGVGS